MEANFPKNPWLPWIERNEREPQGFFLAFEMGNFLDSRSSDIWCTVFLEGGIFK